MANGKEHDREARIVALELALERIARAEAPLPAGIAGHVTGEDREDAIATYAEHVFVGGRPDVTDGYEPRRFPR